MRGVFVRDAGQPSAARRRDLLSGARRLRPPVHATSVPAGDVGVVVAGLRAQLARQGVAIAGLDRPMIDEEFLALGSALGVPRPELSATVQHLVRHDVILNLITTLPATDDPDRQPFGANWLSLHSESSGAPPGAQPRYIVLMCEQPGPSTGAQTVLVPMRAVADALDEDDRAVLRGTRYAFGVGTPTLLREEHGRLVFSVRDFQEQPLSWEHDGHAGDPEKVTGALARLYEAMYGSEAFGITWRRGLLVVIDNTEFFHGRTAGPPPGAGPRRHLKRLRISAPDADT